MELVRGVEVLAPGLVAAVHQIDQLRVGRQESLAPASPVAVPAAAARKDTSSSNGWPRLGMPSGPR